MANTKERLLSAIWFGVFGAIAAVTAINAPNQEWHVLSIVASLFAIILFFAIPVVVSCIKRFLKLTTFFSYSLFVICIAAFCLLAEFIYFQEWKIFYWFFIVYPAILGSLIGYLYGYQILLLPKTNRTYMRAAGIGFVGAMFAFIIIIATFVLISYGLFLISPENTVPIGWRAIFDILFMFLVTLVAGYLVEGWIVSCLGVASALLLYFVKCQF